MFLKSVFYKLLLVLAVVVGWVIYDNLDEIKYTIAKTRHTTVTNVKKILPKEEVKSITAYEWTDTDGTVHISNINPKHTNDVKTRHIKTDQNVIPSVSKYDIPHTKEKKKLDATNAIGTIPKVFEGAKALDTMNNRNRQGGY